MLDQTSDGQRLKYLFELRGAPALVRSDNGPEFVAEAVKAWLAASGSDTLYIEPGSPWENAYDEVVQREAGGRAAGP